MLLRLVTTAIIFLSFQTTYALDLACNYVIPLQSRFLQRHINYDALTKNLENRTVDQFVKGLDPSKVYLLQSDIDAMKKNMNGIFDKAKVGNCKPIDDAYKTLEKRMNESAEFAKTYLGPEFKLDPKLRFSTDSDKRPYAKTKKEAEANMKNYLQLQVATSIAIGKKLDEARDRVAKNYERVAKRLSEETITDRLAAYLDSFARSLDPHSTYWSPTAFDDFRVGIGASLEGIGATLSSVDGLTVIEQLIPGGPAAKSGVLMSKDKIIAVGSGETGALEKVIDKDLRDVVSKIRGAKGTKVRLSILREEAGGANKKFEVTLVREKVSIDDDRASIEYIDRTVGEKKLKVGLINLPSFYADLKGDISSATDMKRLMREARKANVDSLVLDMSANGGGSLEDAVRIAGLFFKEGNVVKQSSKTKGRNEFELADEDPMVDWAGPLVLLTSRVSASASEIVSGALKDYKRAVVVGGDHTFGKGTVQAVDDSLPQGLGAIKTTIGMFFTAGGKSTQHIGVDSDVILPSALSTDEIGEKTLDYSLPPKALKPFLSAEAYVASGPSVWKTIDKSIIEKLKEQSKARVDKEPEFKKIKDEIAKMKKKKNEVIIGEVIKDREESNKEVKEFEGKSYVEAQALRKSKYLKRADVIEALNVAADLAVLQSGGTLTLSKANTAKTVDKTANTQVNPDDGAKN